jgi:hypothetical protein
MFESFVNTDDQVLIHIKLGIEDLLPDDDKEEEDGHDEAITQS